MAETKIIAENFEGLEGTKAEHGGSDIPDNLLSDGFDLVLTWFDGFDMF